MQGMANRCPRCASPMQHIRTIKFGKREVRHTERCNQCKVKYITRMREWCGVWQVQNRREG